MNHTPKPYRTTAVFAGGGLRFGYYLGMYQALCDGGHHPDVVLASCGGALAVAFLEVTSNVTDALTLLKSPATHQMFCRFYGVMPSHRTAFALPALQRLMHTKWQHKRALSQKELSELHSQALFAIQDEDATPLWQFSTDTPTLHSFIILSRLKPSGTGYRWQLTLRPSASIHTEVREQLARLPCALHAYQDERICSDVAVLDLPLAVAVRASINDTYYLSPIRHDGQTLFGGALDLTPVELAHALADTVYIDDKAPYDKLLATPAIHSVFGFDPNTRLTAVKNHPNTHWLPFTDNRTHLRPVVERRYHTRGGLRVLHPSHGEYCNIMDAQWQYGYERTQTYLRTRL